MDALYDLSLIRSLRRQRRFLNPPKTFEKYNDFDFRNLYRFSKEQAWIIISLIRDSVDCVELQGRLLPIEEQILLSLRFFATNNFQKELGDSHGVHQTTVSRIVAHVSESICKLRTQFIKFPDCLRASALVKRRFKDIANFPGVLGIVDGTHIRIMNQPGADGSLYINRKGWSSINTQIVCGPSMEIYDIVARWYGSAHDARIFRESNVHMRFEAGELNGLLLGDSGYPCLPHLMVPFRVPNSVPQRSFNVSLKKTRVKVECTIGVLKRRFPCLQYGLRQKKETCLSIIVACAVLHNMAIQFKDPAFEDKENIEYVGEAEDEHASILDTSQGCLMRNSIVHNYFS